MYGFNQGGFRIPTPVAIGFLLIVLVAAIAIEMPHYQALRKVSQQYHSAPGCGSSGAVVDPALAPCTTEAYTVQQTYQHVYVRNSGRHTHIHTHFMLGLQSAGGNQRTIELENAALWASIKVGDSLKVQIWQGKSRLVYVDGQVSPTSNNPDFQAGQAGQVILILGVIALAAVALLAYGIFAQARGPRAMPFSPAGIFPGQIPAAMGYTPSPGSNIPNPSLGAIAGGGSESVSGQWRGSWTGSSGGRSTSFEAHLEVNNAGIIKGNMTEPGRAAQSVLAGEQEGSAFRFVKRSPRQGPTEVFEFRGEVAPNGLSLAGHWHRVGRLLGLPFRTAGSWSASRVGPPAPASPGPQYLEI